MKSGKKAPAARYKVVEEHPAQALVHRASIAGAVLLALIAGFFLGAHKGEDVIPKKHTKISRLESHVSRLEEESSRLRDELANVQSQRVIGAQTTENVRLDMKAMQERVYELEEAVAFYRQVMVPGEQRRGLHVDRFVVQAIEDQRRQFKYKLVVANISEKRLLVGGKVKVKIVGTVDGKRKSYDLSKLSKGVEAAGMQFRFRYFQEFRGVLNLPVEFVPELIEVSMKGASKRSGNASRQFQWKVQES